MIKTIQLAPGVRLHHYPDKRFKKCRLSIQLLRPMCWEEASKNALIPAVLLRGTQAYPDMRSITWRLDELYGASVGTAVRRVSNIQTVGFTMTMMDDRFAMEPEGVLAPGVAFLRELLLNPVTENGVFREEYVESEKKNLISVIESEINDKRTYALRRMSEIMCRGDSYEVSRLGRVEDLQALTAQSLWQHYRDILRRSPVELFYVGSAEAETVAELLMPIARELGAEAEKMPGDALFVPQSEPGEHFEEMDVNQGNLVMGFTVPITDRDPDYEAMAVLNTLFGAGMTSKLFVNVREKLSLCYFAGSTYYRTRGIMSVSAGIDECNYERAKEEILHQLECCARGEITREELEAAKKSMCASLTAVPDSPGSLEGYYTPDLMRGVCSTPDGFIAGVKAVTVEDLVRCAGKIRLHTVYFLKGESK